MKKELILNIIFWIWLVLTFPLIIIYASVIYVGKIIKRRKQMKSKFKFFIKHMSREHWKK